jgi:acyl-homoserine-lactone acylase
MFNIIYADDEKNIFYLFNGNVPARPLGNFPFWRGTINGSESRFIWKNILPYDSLPRLLNPATGFIQNSNDPPWTCTFPVILKPGNYRPYVAPQHMRFRPQRAVNMIREDHSISFESLLEYIQNTGVETADRFLDDLFSAVEKFPDTLAARAVEVLKHWDRKTDPGSRGALLFMEWFDKIDTSMFLFPWTLRSPVSTPDGLKDEKKAVALLRDAAVKMLARYGSLDIPFGEVYHFKINGRVYPASGGNEKYGIFRSFTYDDEMNKSFAIAGETFVALVEFSKPIKARVLLPYGNASEQGSIHAEDQLELLAEKKLRTALLTRKAVMEQLERREVLHFN